MLVGAAGSGKTVSVAAKLNSLPDSYALTNAPLNFYTTSGKYIIDCGVYYINDKIVVTHDLFCLD